MTAAERFLLPTMTHLLSIQVASRSPRQSESPFLLVITECVLVFAAVTQPLTALAETTTT
jgi:hypothetical protein